MSDKWIKRWGYEMKRTRDPGIMRLRDGRAFVFGKVRGILRMKAVDAPTRRDAQAARQAMLDAARAEPLMSTRQLFAEYATSLFERKVEQRDIKSAKTRERWASTLTLHLIPQFGTMAVEDVTKLEIEAWKTKVSKRITKGELAPTTANGWLSILLNIMRTAVDDLHLERDPTLRVHQFNTEEHATYTPENPNSLRPEQCPAFLAAMERLYPQHYAMTYLGFVLGLRPSTLRPLRRRGPDADLSWSEKTLHIRRSNALGQEVMRTTKTGINYAVGLPDAVMRVLHWHVNRLTRKRLESDLLFPALHGGFMSRSALDKPFARVSREVGLRFVLTPRGMRRTFQDLCKAVGVAKETRKAICGHATDAMSEHYATERTDEMREAVGRVSLALGPEKG